MIVDIVFWVVAVVAVLAGAAVFIVNSMARATYALAASFVAVGVAVLLLQQNYIGVVTILMMVMEMAVMAVYMVMFMGMNPALMPMSMVHDNRRALAAAVGTFIVLATGILLTDWPSRRGAPPPDITSTLGEELMGPKMLAMAVISPAMVATIVAGIVLAARRSRYDRFGDDLTHRPARDPQPGGVGR
ncbi:NADH-quinone oxidoreductase subunit J [Mycobacterium intracellulare]|uniref:NADH-quinone oxidoreductase subunit J n=1 Tax=Mycobacterium intracellulare subsp. chimaera TaxID=222805 RepID=A0ABT7P801_MYCIT|nr:NADH-quinone oxidoreductase subunit J [Mycobacterium intracellulare]AOS92120.1 NADH:ubiquinone oxidoreductase subunit J [Mycobacterium intracellulare subsp. chimaera]ASL09451.1 NADH:ubiquinone oxidoreductase subunit J [Mycobacterium intracellulare subsp. chimaera]ASL21256.1 NADH:ubiquinone oxidoreductase subunit J [Mycobacterium intracellulare subsp. chimaera]ASQ86381.1 NADH:ubiquinone oxidoreductase subunit J [Mycobacterium intracellulare subsp. chimaera]KPN44830.1 NADH:ubiquinone oxidored